MEPARIDHPARNGAVLRQIPMAQEPSCMVGRVANRPSSTCPYNLGASCPIVEIVSWRAGMKGTVEKWSRMAAPFLGIAVSATTVLYVYY